MKKKDFSNRETQCCYEWLTEEEVDQYHWARQASQQGVEGLAELLEYETTRAIEMVTDSAQYFASDLVAELIEEPMERINYRELAEAFVEIARRDPELREYVDWIEEYEESPGFSKRED